MKNRIQKMVSDKYSKRLDEELYEMETTRVSISIPIADAFLFDLIAETFSQSRASLLSECLDAVAHDLFTSLKLEDRHSIGKKADELLAHALNGIYDTYQYNGSLKWGSRAIASDESLMSEIFPETAKNEKSETE